MGKRHSVKAIVTGGAGFVGSSLVDQLLELGADVHVIDNFSKGHRRFLEQKSVTVHELDLLDGGISLEDIFTGADCVYHLAANADVRYGWDHPFRDLEQNVKVTIRVADACVRAGVPELVFSSTGSVYGEAQVIPTLETEEFPVQTSLYGASKTAAEGFLAAFAETGKLKVTVMRFVSVLGPRYTHGHVLDFVTQLTDHPDFLDVLGNGGQKKSYMHIDDCVRALVSLRGSQPFEVFNLGTSEFCTVRDSIGWIVSELGLSPDIRFGEEDRGWIGDNPFIFLDATKAQEHGWVTNRSIEASVVDTVRWIRANDWALDLASCRS